MKKILYLAMAAVLFMACENKGGASGGGAAGGDMGMVEQTSNKLVAALGSADAATVDADLLKLGFKRFEESEADDAPVRKLAPRKLTKATKDYAVYTYNLPENYQSADETEFYKELARTKKLVVILYVGYDQGKFVATEGNCFISQYVANYNAIYTDFSKNLYASIPEQADINWSAEAYSMTGNLYYNSNAELINNFSQVMAVMEKCNFATDKESVEYELMWQRSMDTPEARQQGYEPFCAGGFAFSWKESEGGASGGGSASTDDMDMVEETSNKLIAAVGSADAATVDADLLRLGFKRVEESDAAPARKLAPRKFTKDAENYVEYTYNLPANYTSVEDPAFYQELARTKKLVVILYVAYRNDKLYAAEGAGFISQYVANYNAIYTDFSNNLYASIPAQANINWSAEAYTMTQSLRYTNHADLINNFSQLISVMEECSFAKDNKSVEYELVWNKSIDSAEARQEGIEPFCMGVFGIGLGN